MDDIYLETVDGRKWKLTPVSGDLISRVLAKVDKEFKERGEPIDPPTYDVPLIGGGSEKFAHDTKSIEQKNDPELTEQWKKYQDAQERLFKVKSDKRFDLRLREGLYPNVKESEYYKSDEWVKRHTAYGIGDDIPTDEEERLKYFVFTEVLKTQEDTYRFIATMQVLTNQGRIDQQEVDRLLGLFRSFIPKRPIQRTARHAARRPAKKAGALVKQQSDG